jgi:secondary thiamine-phosphate synthase enzyme
MKILNETFTFSTRGEIDFIDLSDKVQEVVSRSGIRNGLAHVFAPHATGVIILTEHEPSLDNDVRNLLEKLIPKRASYQHPANAHSHLRSMLFCPDRTLPVIDGRVVLGTWQSLVFVETDVHPRRRTVIIQAIGE